MYDRNEMALFQTETERILLSARISGCFGAQKTQFEMDSKQSIFCRQNVNFAPTVLAWFSAPNAALQSMVHFYGNAWEQYGRHCEPKCTRFQDVAYTISIFRGWYTRAPAEASLLVLRPRINFRLAHQRSHCSCFTILPMLQGVRRKVNESRLFTSSLTLPRKFPAVNRSLNSFRVIIIFYCYFILFFADCIFTVHSSTHNSLQACVSLPRCTVTTTFYFPQNVRPTLLLVNSQRKVENSGWVIPIFSTSPSPFIRFIPLMRGFGWQNSPPDYTSSTGYRITQKWQVEWVSE